MSIILASQSPRRRELLEQMGITDFIVRPARGEEKAAPGLTPARLVEELSLRKGLEVASDAQVRVVFSLRGAVRRRRRRLSAGQSVRPLVRALARHPR